MDNSAAWRGRYNPTSLPVVGQYGALQTRPSADHPRRIALSRTIVVSSYMNPARRVGRNGTMAASATSAAAIPLGIARRVVIDSRIGARSAPPLRKGPVEEADEGGLPRRMREPARGAGA